MNTTVRFRALIQRTLEGDAGIDRAPVHRAIASLEFRPAARDQYPQVAALDDLVEIAFRSSADM